MILEQKRVIQEYQVHYEKLFQKYQELRNGKYQKKKQEVIQLKEYIEEYKKANVDNTTSYQVKQYQAYKKEL